MDKIKDTITNDDIIDDLKMDEVHALLARNFDNTAIPYKLWKRLDNETREKIFELRKIIQEESKQDSDATKDTQRASNVTQHRANLATKNEDDKQYSDESSDTDGSIDPNTDDEADDRTAMMLLADLISDNIQDRQLHTLRTVHCDLDKLKRLQGANVEVFARLGHTKDTALSTVDSGADTCIIGTGWNIVDKMVGQTANVFGFDTNHAQKRGLPIGTGDAVVIGYELGHKDEPFEFIVRVHQAVVNDNSDTTLISELQSRDNQAIVDTVHSKFSINTAGERGTQRIILQVQGKDGEGMKNIVIPLAYKRGLMTFEHRKPLTVDYEVMEIYELTGSRPWDPRLYTDDAPYARDAAGIPRIVNDVQANKYFNMVEVEEQNKDEGGAQQPNSTQLQEMQDMKEKSLAHIKSLKTWKQQTLERIEKLKKEAMETGGRKSPDPTRVRELERKINSLQQHHDCIEELLLVRKMFLGNVQNAQSNMRNTLRARNAMRDELNNLTAQRVTVDGDLKTLREDAIQRKQALETEAAKAKKQDENITVLINARIKSVERVLDKIDEAQQGMLDHQGEVPHMDTDEDDDSMPELISRRHKFGDDSSMSSDDSYVRDFERDYVAIERENLFPQFMPTMVACKPNGDGTTSEDESDEEVEDAYTGPMKSIKRYQSDGSAEAILPERKKRKTMKHDPRQGSADHIGDEKSNNSDDIYTWYFNDGFQTSTDSNIPTSTKSHGQTTTKVNDLFLNIDFKDILEKGEQTNQSDQVEEIDALLGGLTLNELTGHHMTKRGDTPFDSYAFALQAVRDFCESELAKLRPNFGFRPTDIIRKTLENTTQYAKSFSPFPLHKHWKAMFKWFNLQRLQETVCTDTVLVNTPCIGTGATCAQVFYGVKSKMINVYGMVTKSGAHEAYQDFLREEGIPSILHRDNSGEQNDQRFKSTNRELLVKDTTTEPHHPHQNPAETRAIRFLKRAGKTLITMSGAPAETWFYAMKYVALINNWTSHESLKWKTPFEKRHGTKPDISSLLAFRFYEPVYYYVEEGFPDSGEKLGYIMGLNENVGSHMTFDLLTDDKQTVITRSVLRAVVEPTPNLRLTSSQELDPDTRIRDRENAMAEATTPQERDNVEIDGFEVIEPNRDVATNVEDGRENPHAHTLDEFNPTVFEQDFLERLERGEIDPRPVVPNPRFADPLPRRPRLILPPARPLEEPIAVDMLFNPPQGDNLGQQPPDEPNEPPDLDIFVDDALPMHHRHRRRRKEKHRAKHKQPTRTHPQRKRKYRNVAANKKHARSNKKKVRKIPRLLQQSKQPSGNLIIDKDDIHDHEEEYVIEDILSHRQVPKSNSYEVLISWEGYDSSEDTWEPASNIKATAAETLARYAIDSGLSRQKGWEWTHKYNSPSTDVSTDTVSNPAPVEGGPTRVTRSKRAQTPNKNTKANKMNSSRSHAKFINESLNTFGLGSNNNTSNYTVKNYVDFDIHSPQPPTNSRNIPIETVTYEDPMQDITQNVAKVLELQQLDKAFEKEDVWTIIKVLKHASRRVTRRIPNGNEESPVTKEKHMRLLVLFNDGDTKWVPLDAALLQDPYPVIEYVRKNKLEKNEKFRAVQKMMKQTEKVENLRRIFKAKVSKAPRYQFGVEVPRDTKHAALLDKVNGNNLWDEANQKELNSINQHKVFRLSNRDGNLRDYRRIPYRMIYTCKHTGRRKARLVAGGHMTDPPAEDVYSGVVGMDTVRLAFAVGAMQGLDVCACDISTAFLYGKTKEKVYIVAGPEFGPDLEGKKLIVQGNWYGLKSAAATYHSVASAVLRKLGFTPTKVDADLWMRRKDDHYEYLAIYVDDLLAWGRKPLEIIEEVKNSFKLQGIGFPDYYLGADVNPINEPHLLKEGCVLGLSAETYIKNALHKLEPIFGGGPPRKAKSPMIESYHPESDDSPLLGTEDITKYRALLGSANWTVTLGRFDITYATNTLARYSIAPREGHLVAMKRVFGYLRTFPKGELMINPKPFNHTKPKPREDSWDEYYPDASEELPPDQPEPLPTKAQVTIYVDADHAHDTVTRRSVTGIMVFVNQTLVKYLSKRQKTVETSSYGSELVAARIATELAMEYRYSLRMLGVELDGPVRMFGDNNSVVINTTMPSSMLKKKHQSIAYHAVRMAQAANVITFEHIRSESNWADVLTKPLSPMKFHQLIRPLLFRRSGRKEEEHNEKE